MASPTTAINRFDLSISYAEFSLAMNQRKFIGHLVLPPIAVAMQSADFLRIKIASVLGPVKETVRKEKSSYRRDDFEWEKDSYATEDHGKEEVLDDRGIKRFRNEINAEMIHRERAINAVLQKYEDDVAKAVFNTTTWTGASLTTTVGTAWTTAATADPIADIDAAVDKVESGIGSEPNTLVLSKKAFRAMIRTTRLEDLLKYDSSEVLIGMNTGQNSQLVNRVMAGLHDLLQLERILVGRGFKNTADEGQTPAFGRFWDETMAMVCHVNYDGMDGDLESPEPNIGRTIMWAEENVDIPAAGGDAPGLIVEEYREDSHRGSVLRARNDRQVKIIHKEAGHLLQGVTA